MTRIQDGKMRQQYHCQDPSYYGKIIQHSRHQNTGHSRSNTDDEQKKEYSKGANRNETREAYTNINKKIQDLERTIQKDVKELRTAFKQRLK